MIAISVFCFSTADAGQPRTVEELMSLLGQVEYVKAEYRETRESSLLSVPISSRGRLEYRAPDRILMSSDKGDRVEISGETLRVLHDEKLVRELSASDHRSIESLVSALKAMFSGNLTRLRQDFRLSFRAGDGDWSLDLVPTAARSMPLMSVTRIGVSGTGAVIEQIALTESDGDVRRLRMKILDRKPGSLP
jgi:hypothetical protein